MSVVHQQECGFAVGFPTNDVGGELSWEPSNTHCGHLSWVGGSACEEQRAASKAQLEAGCAPKPFEGPNAD